MTVRDGDGTSTLSPLSTISPEVFSGNLLSLLSLLSKDNEFNGLWCDRTDDGTSEKIPPSWVREDDEQG